MSKRAEEAALKAYPLKDYTKEPNYIHTCDTKMLDEVYRDVFKLGYKLAESMRPTIPAVPDPVPQIPEPQTDNEQTNSTTVEYVDIPKDDPVTEEQ